MKNKLWLIAALLLALAGGLFKFALTGHDFIGYLLFFAAVMTVLYHLAGKKLRLAFTVALIAGALCFALIEAPVVSAAKTDEGAQADYLIVLGAGLHGDVPSLSLTDRLEAALSWLEENPEAMVIVSGGQGPGENMTEAEAMGIWLEARGIEPGRIILEDRATSTEENLRFSFELIRSRGDEPSGSTAVVTSEYHLYRAKLMAESQGVTVYGVAARTSIPSLALNYFIREAFAVVYYRIFGG